MPQDIVALLGEDHARLAQFAAELRGCAQPAAAYASFDGFAVQLGGHLTMVRRVAYPALKAAGWRNVESSLLVGEARLSHSFTELLTLRTPDVAFARALSELLDAMLQLIDLECRQLLPPLAALSEGTRLAMASDAALYLPAPRAVPAEQAVDGALQRPSARDWMEQGRLLLGGTPPAHDAPGADAPSAQSAAP